ncbi:MAG: 2-amino-4-hydroxy-6-hydroxymethyldihydropteridine diphosphokinase [Coxiellaceae bacterium]|nr:2-amino-4-hydroxy-6-hydroxymethyldihydropteridine diphosphokinase [Coxiellaceae bacterium]
MKTAYIGVGSNLDMPVLQVQEAIDRLRDVPGVVVCKVSQLYQSKPLGPKDQSDFINAVVKIETNLSAEELLNFLQRIEESQKRIRAGKRWGPRTIDLDILLFGDEKISTRSLKIPHPGLSQREFVVYPLAEIAPDLRLPSGETIDEIKAQCPVRGMTVLPIEQRELVE